MQPRRHEIVHVVVAAGHVGEDVVDEPLLALRFDASETEGGVAGPGMIFNHGGGPYLMALNMAIATPRR